MENTSNHEPGEAAGNWTPPENQIEPPRDVVISVNPIAGSGPTGRRVDRLAALLRQQGFEPHVLTDLEAVAAETNGRFAEGRLRALVGAGGDGTAAELVNRTTPGVPLALLPSGTENLLARYLGLGRSPEEICRVVAQGRTARFDAASASGRIFLLMISCGFDADVVRRVQLRRRGQITKLTWGRPILESIWTYRYPRISVSWDWENKAGSTRDNATDAEGSVILEPWEVGWLFAFNLPCYGGGFRIAPLADGRDGLLDLCSFKCSRFRTALGCAMSVRLGRHRRMANCLLARARRFRIRADDAVPYQLDGDFGGSLPVDVEVLPQRLTVLVP